MYQISNNLKNDGYFIPHHGIFKKTYNQGKIRVVFDASAKTDTGVSLNDVQYIGPPLLNDITSILLCFRQHTYALTADIEKMYRNINVNNEHRKYQRIFWRENVDDEIQCFELKP